MTVVNIHAAKTHLSRLIEQVAAGEEIVIAKAGVPVAKLVPLAAPANKKRPAGLLAGRGPIPDDFDAPLPDDLLDLFHNGPIFPPERR